MRRAVLIGVALLVCSGHPWAQDDALSNLFSVFGPAVKVSPAERDRLARGGVVVRTLDGEAGQLAVFASTRISAPPEALLAWNRAIVDLKRTPGVRAVGRFSDLPQVGNLAALQIDEDDLLAMRRCTPGDCGVKLDAVAIARVRDAAAAASEDGWREAVARAFKEVLVMRVRQHQAGGLAALAPAADKAGTRSPADVLTSMVRGAQAPLVVPAIAAAFHIDAPSRVSPGAEGFYYWSKERYEAGKDVISLTYVTMTGREAVAGPAAVVASQQIFASHYVSGASALSAVIRDPDKGQLYLAYLNRSSVDLFSGRLGFLQRAAEQRIERQVPALVRQLRDRLQQPPPVRTTP